MSFSSDEQSGSPFETTQAPSFNELNELLPGFVFFHLIGVGKMGAVYVAKQESLDRNVAVKILPRRYFRDAEFVENFRTEAKALARLNHNRLVQIYDFGVVDELLFIVMEYVEGDLLHNLLEKGTFSAYDTALVARDICQGLKYAHGKGITHGAVRARNAILGPKGGVKLIDFWMYSFKDDLNGGRDISDMRYAAPEFVSRRNIDQRSDIYSLGVLILKCVTGLFPREFAELAEEYQPMLGDLYRVVYNCIRSNPDNRYQTVGEIEREINRYLEAHEPPAPQTPFAF